jgi:hypothetical protein
VGRDSSVGIATRYGLGGPGIESNERLVAINLATTTTCSRCGTTDTLQHRIIECEESAVIWDWTRAQTAAILRVDNKYVSEEWTLRPTFQFWPPQRHAAIVWMIAHLVVYRFAEPATSLPYRLCGFHVPCPLEGIPSKTSTFSGRPVPRCAVAPRPPQQCKKS